MDFNMVELFENKIADFFGAPYAIAFDSCIHGRGAFLYLTKAKKIII
jgi:dTDP-4-amino-4,6-dideoxygalactose transaminase